MSEGYRMSYSWAMKLAENMLAVLQPYCERIEIAGSLRRKKETVGDIEIVLIPFSLPDLLGEEHYGAGRITNVLSGEGLDLTKDGPYFKQVMLPDGKTKFDIFLTNPEKWGCVFTIRTGSAEFVHKLVTKRSQGGFCPSNLRFKDGRIWNGDEVLDTPEEEDVFNALNMKWVKPESRELKV